MNPNGTFDRDLERWLEAEAPSTEPVGLHDAVIEQARRSGQRPRWLVAARGGTLGTPVATVGRPALRSVYVLVLLGLIFAVVLVAVAGGALRPDPAKVVLPSADASAEASASVPPVTSQNGTIAYSVRDTDQSAESPTPI